MIAFMRCVLAVSALAIIYLDPTEPARYVELTYASLAVYCAWAVVLFFGADAPWGAVPSRWAHWIDVGCATYLVALTEGTNSVFFFLFLFAILVASFSRGSREGLAVTAASTVLFVVVGFPSATGTREFELNRALIRPTYLLALGAMMAFWGGRELALRRRLLLLREVGRDWNPRLGVARALGTNLERMLQFFAAQQCLLVLEHPTQPPRWEAFVASREGKHGAHLSRDIDEATARTLLALPEKTAISYVRGRSADAPAECAQLANLLETDHFASVGYAQRDGTRGRLYVTPAGGPIARSDLDFLVQLTAAVAQLAENTQLAEQLVTKAAEQERFRISLDIHDTTIQPYIGLKLGLEALHREAGPDNPLEARIADLLDMATMTIRDLRGYATGLRENPAFPGAALEEAIREQAARMGRFYGVEVEVHVDPDLRLVPHACAEVFRIVSEGLSNVLRHTVSKRAIVRLVHAPPVARISLGNETRGPVRAFMPRSISERARSLGGEARVEHGPGPFTFVHVEIPA